jgi:hypothetical protein
MCLAPFIRPEGPAPKGLEDSAQGFNPGNQPIKRFALKGREERAIKTYYNDTLLSCVVSTFDLPPLQGVSLGGRFPGLKPWAESYSPFGA